MSKFNLICGNEIMIDHLTLGPRFVSGEHLYIGSIFAWLQHKDVSSQLSESSEVLVDVASGHEDWIDHTLHPITPLECREDFSFVSFRSPGSTIVKTADFINAFKSRLVFMTRRPLLVTFPPTRFHVHSVSIVDGNVILYGKHKV